MLFAGARFPETCGILHYEMNVELGQVIAERTLTFTAPDIPARTVVVKLGAPQQGCDRPDDWFCPWQIVGVGSEKVMYAAGVDAFHVFQLVMGMIGVTLHCEAERAGLRMYWLDEADSDIGFPNGSVT
jgi:hypothetical protein